jgi:hypothetical protein
VKSDTTGALTSPGFRILREQDKLTITRDLNASVRRKRMMILGVCLAFCCAIYLNEFVRIGNGAKFTAIPWLLLSICAIAPLLFALRAVYPGTDGLLCTRESVEVKRTLQGKVKDVRVFQMTDVKRLQYVAEIFPWLGTAGCLGFLAKGKQVTCLSGLKHSDVRIVLAELEGMGFDVVPEPEMPAEGHFEEESGRKE